MNKEKMMNWFDNPNYDHYANCMCPTCRPELYQKVEGKNKKNQKIVVTIENLEFVLAFLLIHTWKEILKGDLKK